VVLVEKKAILHQATTVLVAFLQCFKIGRMTNLRWAASEQVLSIVFSLFVESDVTRNGDWRRQVLAGVRLKTRHRCRQR